MISAYPSYLFYIGLFFFGFVALFAYIILTKNEQIHGLQNTVQKITRSFQELDEQAKLIIKTDLELNKAQEELDRRLSGLEALQKISRLITTTLDEDEIFQRLQLSLKTDLNFEKNLIFTYNENKILQKKISLGYNDQETNYISNNLTKNNNLTEALREGHTVSSVDSPRTKKETLAQIFHVEHFVISPILTQDGVIGIFFVGNRSNTLPITAGDEEVISILANQIGQSLENARLFEEVYRSSQQLEVKIKDRTKELASALEEVKSVSKIKSEFVSAVSHELRTPLTSIKGYASILISDKLGQVPLPVKERLEKINIHSDNLVKLINDLLDIARIESGRMEMQFQKHRLDKIIEAIYDLLQPQIKAKNINFKVKIPTDLPEALLDNSQIDRVFINLLGNAIKFTPEGGSVELTASADGDNIKVEISDTGIGISEKDLNKIFTEFYRAENAITQNIKGTGLGLSLAKKIIDAHGGKIWARSQLNKGTTFCVTLPIEGKPT